MSGDNGGASRVTTEELRAAVRSVLREVLPAPASSTATASDGEVAIRTDAELAAFVHRVAVLCEEPTQRAELQAGRHRFRLAAAHTATGSQPPPAAQLQHEAGSAVRVDRGAVTERAVKNAFADGKRLVVGRRAVLTPLARDKARSLGVVIEKES